MKNLKAGETVETPYGETWDSAIMVVDEMKLDYLNQNMEMIVSIYLDSTARSEFKKPFSERHFVSKDEFLANFDITEAINTLKSQSEDYALTLHSKGLGIIIGDKFE